MSTPKPTLESARLKLERSRELLKQLQFEMDATSKDPPPVTFRPAVREGPWMVVYADEVTFRPPPRWGSLAGEAMHAARSALDHLACRLVELENNPVSYGTAFPIWETEPRTRDERKNFDRAIEGMNPDHQESIRLLQPYKHPKSTMAAMLLALAEIDNTDKHRIITLQQMGLDKEQLGGTASSVIMLEWNANVAIEAGVEIVRFRYDPYMHPDLKIDLVCGFRVGFGETGIGIKEMYSIRNYCSGIVESFFPIFK